MARLLRLSGLYFPLKSHSTLEEISAWFPVRHFITAVFQTFSHPHASAWPGHDLFVIAIWGAVGAFVALRRFSWSPHRA